METWTSQLVLVVGDHAVRATYCDWLLAGGFEVAEAVDGSDAMAATVADLPDLVLTEAQLSGPVTLLDLCMYFDARGVRVIVADSAADDRSEVALGCDRPVLTRPDGRSLCAEVRRVLLMAQSRPDDDAAAVGTDDASEPAAVDGQPDPPLDAPVARPGKS